MIQQFPRGLKALMQPSRRRADGPIPEGLQGVIDLQEGLRKLSGQFAMTTPEGRPTIASMLQQAAEQQVQPSAPSPQMQPQTPGTLPQAAQAAGIAGQQQQAQQQQAMQAAMRMAQQAQPPQGMARGGIAMLPADSMARMKYARGGIIGFAGQGPSYVQPQRREGESFEAFRQRTIAEQEAVQQKIAAEKAAKAEAERKAEMQRRGMVVSPFMDPGARGVQTQPPASTATPADDASQESARFAARFPQPEQTMEDILRQYGGAKTPQATKVVPQAAVPRVAAPQAVKPEEIEAPTLTGAVGEARMARGQDDIFERSLRKISEGEEKFRKEMPDLFAQGIAALTQSDAERQRLLESQRARDQFNRTYSFFRSLYTRGNEYQANQMAVDVREEAARKAGLEGQLAILRLKQAQQADALGQFDRARKLEVEVQAHKDKQDQLLGTYAGAAATLGAATYKSKIDQKIHAEDRAARERMGLMELGQRARELRAKELEVRLGSINSGVAAAQSKIQDQLMKEYKPLMDMINMPGSNWQKNPDMVRQYQGYLAAKKALEDKYLKPFEDQRERIQYEIDKKFPMPKNAVVERVPGT